MQTLEVLLKARALIADPKHWTQNSEAKTREGLPVQALNPQACSFCSIGALVKATGSTTEWAKHSNSLRLAIRSSYPFAFSLSNFNDNHPHSQVLEIWDKAIENERTRNPDQGS